MRSWKLSKVLGNFGTRGENVIVRGSRLARFEGDAAKVIAQSGLFITADIA